MTKPEIEKVLRIPSIMRCLALILIFSGASGCTRHLLGADDLLMSAGKHHTDLRWGRTGNAALAIHPDFRSAFVSEWAKNLTIYDLVYFEVLNTNISQDGDSADITMVVQWVEKQSQALHEETFVEKWVRTNEGWLAIRPLHLSAGSAASAPPQAPAVAAP